MGVGGVGWARNWVGRARSAGCCCVTRQSGFFESGSYSWGIFRKLVVDPSSETRKNKHRGRRTSLV